MFANDTSGVTNASALVTVNPSITLSPSTASLGSSVTATLNGLMVGQETWHMVSSNWTGTATLTLGSGSTTPDDYRLAQDNVPTYVSYLTGNPYGYATYTISAAGYPMLHAIQLVNQSAMPNVLVATAWLNIIGTTNVGTTTLNQINATVNQISSQVSSVSTTLTGMQGTLTNIQSSLTSLQTAVGNLGSTLSSDYSALSSSLSSVSSSLSSMSSTLSSVQSEAAQISSVNSMVLATIVIAIIVLVLEIVVLIRRR